MIRCLSKQANQILAKDWEPYLCQYLPEEKISFEIHREVESVPYNIGKVISQWCTVGKYSFVWNMTEMPDQLILNLAEVLYGLINSLNFSDTFLLYSWFDLSLESSLIDIRKLKFWGDKTKRAHAIDAVWWMFVGKNQSIRPSSLQNFIFHDNSLTIYCLLDQNNPYCNLSKKYYFGNLLPNFNNAHVHFYFSHPRGHQILNDITEYPLNPAKSYFIAVLDPKPLLLSGFLAYKKMTDKGFNTQIVLPPNNHKSVSFLSKQRYSFVCPFHWMT